MLFRKLKDKKGVSLEMSIVFMLMMFALCSLILVTVTVENRRNRYYLKEAGEGIKIENYGQDFYDYVLKYGKLEDFNVDDFNKNLDGYLVEKTGSSSRCQLVVYKNNQVQVNDTITENKRVVYLDIIIDNSTGQIERWYFIDPMLNDQYLEDLHRNVEEEIIEGGD